MIKQGTEGRKGRATEIPGGWEEEPQKCLLGGGDKSHKNTSLEYSSVPGTRFSKVPVTFGLAKLFCCHSGEGLKEVWK